MSITKPQVAAGSASMERLGPWLRKTRERSPYARFFTAGQSDTQGAP